MVLNASSVFQDILLARTRSPASWVTSSPVSSRNTSMRLLQKGSSASSSLDFWVKPFQLHAGIFDAELPIDAALFGVRLVGPGSDCRVQFGQCTDAVSAPAWARQAAQLACRDMQPAAVLRGGAAFDPFHVCSREVRCERFIERAFGVCVLRLSHTKVTYAQSA